MERCTLNQKRDGIALDVLDESPFTPFRHSVAKLAAKRDEKAETAKAECSTSGNVPPPPPPK